MYMCGKLVVICLELYPHGFYSFHNIINKANSSDLLSLIIHPIHISTLPNYYVLNLNLITIIHIPVDKYRKKMVKSIQIVLGNLYNESWNEPTHSINQLK